MRANVRRIAVAKRDELMNKRNVIGVMAGREFKNGAKTDRDAVVVLVKKKIPIAELDTTDLVPHEFLENGSEIPTDVIEVGEIKALHTNKHRPVVPGTSIGHFAITAGTLGLVVDKAGQQYILSNNHVLANENNASRGDAILQPGPIDGGRSTDKVAELADFIPINFSGNNLVDCALAKFVGDSDPGPDPGPDPEPPTPPKPPKDNDSKCPVAGAFVYVLNKAAAIFGRETRLKAVRPTHVESQATEGVEYLNEPLNLGITITRQVADVTVGDVVQKSGRTTRVTVDEVIGTDSTVDVSYDGGVARFVDQIICGPMSAGGDSGSVVYDANGNAIGLLFAGSDTITIVNRIQDVFTALDIDNIS